jgi:polyhydroxyalkanoate synthesis regulator phasin
MDETQNLAVRALRELLDNPERDDWDDLLAANRALIKAIETGEPMARKDARIVADKQPGDVVIDDVKDYVEALLAQQERDREEAEAKQREALETMNRDLRTRLRQLAQHYEEATAIALAGIVPRETRTAIDKVLHPDHDPSTAKRLEACQRWNAWKGDSDRARRRRSS